MKKYFYFCVVNGNQVIDYGETYTNKAECLKDAKCTIYGYHFQQMCNHSYYYVFDDKGVIVFAGHCYDFGRWTKDSFVLGDNIKAYI